MSSFSRRDFLGQSAVAVGALAAAGSNASAAATVRSLKSGVDQVTLGRTGIKTSLVGIGTGSNGVRHSSNQMRLGHEKFVKLIRHAYDQGIRYIDTADQYGSHIYLRDALKGLPRDTLFIQTKTHALNREMALADIDRLREELGVDYLDTLLLHCMQKSSWPTDLRPVMDTLAEAKAKGKIRAHGVSCHGMDPLRAAVKCDWVDVDLARINPIGFDKGRMDGSPDDVAFCLKAMHAKGKGIIGMKILAEGTLKTPEAQMNSLRFVLGLGCVDCMVIGFETPNQIDEILQRVETALKT
jgi:aryl-alcohol dehydrogenase-like predicted oxidoreductase